MTKPFIAETTVKKGNVQIGEDSKIWNFCNIYGTKEKPIVIGDHTQIGAYCEIQPGVTIGRDCRFQSYIFIPEGTQIGNNVFIGPGAKFANDKHPTSRKAIEGTWNLEAAIVGDSAVIGLGALIHAGIRVGQYAVIGLGAVVRNDVADYQIVIGNPAEVIGDIRSEEYREKFGIPPEIYKTYQARSR